MKKIILLLILCCYSCKENKYEYDIESAVDTTVVATEEFIEDSVVAPEIIPEVEKELTYEEALQTTSISDLENFITNNPNHKDIEKLKSRLIDLEVDEIYYDKSTGKMPASDKVSESNSSTSEVSIKNDTSCELIVRYSGVESKMIAIPANQSRSLSIQSGSYRITASACGYNYAGSESLSGDYTSSYYIETRYR